MKLVCESSKPTSKKHIAILVVNNIYKKGKFGVYNIPTAMIPSKALPNWVGVWKLKK